MAKGFGIFKSGAQTLKLSLTNVVIALVLALVLFQAFGLIFGTPLGLDIKLGPVFILLPLGIASVLGVAIVKKSIQGDPISQQDIYAVVVVLVLALIVMFFLRDFVPEAFSVQILELQSVIGFGG